LSSGYVQAHGDSGKDSKGFQNTPHEIFSVDSKESNLISVRANGNPNKSSDVTPLPLGEGPGVGLKGHIVFENVTFIYPDTGIKALENVSFEVLPGQKFAIIGRTGSGKTTIADLMVRMYDVTEGRILIDGKDIRQHDLYNLRRRIGYVPQDVFLFSDTVYGNIAFGKDGITREEAEFYAKSAAVHEDILGLAKGYDTVVGERGVTLSGGQKQRVSIARAFAKQPDLVILDDCLSAVDTNTESRILGYLENALAERTALIITHRIYGMLQFDKVIVLDEHRIAESGTHDELIARGGYYAELFEKQLAGEPTE
jgi:ATP-binding cassette subfamily B protein